MSFHFCVILSGVRGVEGPRCPHRERGAISRHINDASLLFVDGKRFYAMKIKSIPAEDTDLEALALSQNKRFWHLFDAAYESAEQEGWIDLKDLD